MFNKRDGGKQWKGNFHCFVAILKSPNLTHWCALTSRCPRGEITHPVKEPHGPSMSEWQGWGLSVVLRAPFPITYTTLAPAPMVRWASPAARSAPLTEDAPRPALACTTCCRVLSRSILAPLTKPSPRNTAISPFEYFRLSTSYNHT